MSATATRTTSDNGRAALEFASQGLRVFPCNRDKKPITNNGFKSATTDADRIREWWEHSPDALVGVHAIGLLVLDVDGPKGREALAGLVAKHGPLPATRVVTTGRENGGAHYYFRVGVDIPNTESDIAEGLDTRGHKGYAIAFGRHRSGRHYESNGLRIADGPQWLIDVTLAAKPDPAAVPAAAARPVVISSETDPWGAKALANICEEMAGARESFRNKTLNRLAYRVGRIVGGGRLAESDGLQAIVAAAMRSGLTEREAAYTAKRSIGEGMRTPDYGPEPREPRNQTNTGGLAPRPAVPSTDPGPEDGKPRLEETPAERKPVELEDWGAARPHDRRASQAQPTIYRRPLLRQHQASRLRPLQRQQDDALGALRRRSHPTRRDRPLARRGRRPLRRPARALRTVRTGRRPGPRAPDLPEARRRPRSATRRSHRRDLPRP